MLNDALKAFNTAINNLNLGYKIVRPNKRVDSNAMGNDPYLELKFVGMSSQSLNACAQASKDKFLIQVNVNVRDNDGIDNASNISDTLLQAFPVGFEFPNTNFILESPGNVSPSGDSVESIRPGWYTLYISFTIVKYS